MKKSTKIVNTASSFARQSAAIRRKSILDNVENGKQLALACDSAVNPQARAAMLLGMVTAGQIKLPACMAAIAGRGADEMKVVDFVNDYAAAIDSVRDAAGYSVDRVKNLKGNCRKAAQKWADGQDHMKGLKLGSPKGASATRFQWNRDEEIETGTEQPIPADVDSANDEKQAAKDSAKIAKLEKAATTAGMVAGRNESAELVAAQAAEIESLKAQLTASAEAEYRALCLAKAYQLAGNSDAASKRQLTKAISAAKARAKAAYGNSSATAKQASAKLAELAKSAAEIAAAISKAA